MEAFGIEYHLVDSCNLNCAGCNHFSPLSQGVGEVGIERFERELLLLKDKTEGGGKVNWIRLLGGEPLLHRQINYCLETARSVFPNSSIDLITNGLRLANMPESFYSSCRENSIRIGLTDYGLLDLVVVRQDVTRRGIMFNLYRTDEKWYYKSITLAGGHSNCFDKCYQRKYCMNYRLGRLYPCAQIAYIDIFNAFFRQSIEVVSTDYVEVGDVASYDELRAELASLTPLFCRKYCNNHEPDGTSPHKGARACRHELCYF